MRYCNIIGPWLVAGAVFGGGGNKLVFASGLDLWFYLQALKLKLEKLQV